VRAAARRNAPRRAAARLPVAAASGSSGQLAVAAGRVGAGQARQWTHLALNAACNVRCVSMLMSSFSW